MSPSPFMIPRTWAMFRNHDNHARLNNRDNRLWLGEHERCGWKLKARSGVSVARGGVRPKKENVLGVEKKEHVLDVRSRELVLDGNIQNMNYQSLIYNKKKRLLLFFFVFRFSIFSNIFWHFWSGLCYRLLFLMRLSDSVYFFVQMKIFCFFSDFIFWKMSQKCEQYSYDLFVIFGDFFGFMGSPHPHPRRQCQSSLPGERMWKIIVFWWFLWKELENKWKMALRRVAEYL